MIPGGCHHDHRDAKLQSLCAGSKLAIRSWASSSLETKMALENIIRFNLLKLIDLTVWSAMNAIFEYLYPAENDACNFKYL